MRYKGHYREDKNHFLFIFQITLLVTFSSIAIVYLVNCAMLAGNCKGNRRIHHDSATNALRWKKVATLSGASWFWILQGDSPDKRINLFVANRSV
jgi:hypothetical protein